MPPGILSLRCCEEAKLIQCKRAQWWNSTAGEQLNCDAWLWGSPRAKQSWGQAPLLLGTSAQLWADLLCFVPRRSLQQFSCSYSQETVAISFWWERMFSSRTRWQLAYIDRSLHPWFLIGLSSWEWGLQILTVCLVQKELSWLVIIGPLWLLGAASCDWMGEA